MFYLFNGAYMIPECRLVNYFLISDKLFLFFKNRVIQVAYKGLQGEVTGLGQSAFEIFICKFTY